VNVEKRRQKHEYSYMRFEFDQGGSKPRDPNNVILNDLEMLDNQTA